jgi:two-component system response regulator YesN
MYRLIIADDEIDVRERLLATIKKLNTGFEIVGAYENGYDALEGVIALKPDLIITDIKMPYIDGLELIKSAKLFYPLIKSIIITGFDEFDYAKQAINLGVISYISKPLTEEELAASIQKVKNILDEEFNVSSDVSGLIKKDPDSLKLLQESDLLKLVSLKEVPQAFADKLANDDIDIKAPNIILAIFDLDIDYVSIPYEKIELADLYLRKYLNDDLSAKYNLRIFPSDYDTCVFLSIKGEVDLEDLEEDLRAITARIRKISGISISCGTSDFSKDTKDRNFRKLFRHAKRALEYRTLFGCNEVIFFDNISKEETKMAKVDDNEYSSITFDLLYGEMDTLNSRLTKLINDISREDYVDSYNFILDNIVDAMLKACRDFCELYNTYMTHQSIVTRLASSKEKNNVIQYLEELGSAIHKVNQESREKGVDSSLKQVMTYIECNYRKCDLCMESLSTALGFSISYISQLLKRSNTTFTKYLTQLRMEKAKILLNVPNNKVISVANDVGYSDPYYFSHCFKKYEGTSPQSFRKHEKDPYNKI